MRVPTIVVYLEAGQLAGVSSARARILASKTSQFMRHKNKYFVLPGGRVLLRL